VSAQVRIDRAGPLLTVQDLGRFGMLAHGVSASGPMDREAYVAAGRLLGTPASGGLEFTTAGLDLTLQSGRLSVGMAGGAFRARGNGAALSWPARFDMVAGDTLSITPGTAGNYGYLRFDLGLDVPKILGSLSTNSRAQLGGLEGRALRAGDRLAMIEGPAETEPAATRPDDGPIRVVWGLHAALFASPLRERFVSTAFGVSSRLDRMGVRLDDPAGVFAQSQILSLVSDAIVPGDIQILGDGTPIVLMRDHQPTGGYPRIATVITADLDRFAQMRPGASVAFEPVSVDHAHRLMRRTGP